MKEVVHKLLTVKSIVTFLSTAAFVWLSIRGQITATEFLTVFTMIISFYFGTQAEKKNGGE